MDSKVIRLAVAVFVSLMALILVIVYAVNADKINAFLGIKSSDEASLDSAFVSSIDIGEPIGNNMHGFMAKKNFFDEPDALASIHVEDVTGLYMDVKAGAGQIRISIKNARGGLETGTPFAVMLQKRDEEESHPAIYSDDDQNGQILISDLEKGNYVLTLQPRDGYHIPLSPVNVNITESSVSLSAASSSVSATTALESNGESVSSTSASKESSDDSSIKGASGRSSRLEMTDVSSGAITSDSGATTKK